MASPPSPPSDYLSEDYDSPRRHPMSRFRDDIDPLRGGRPRRRGPSPPPFVLRQLQQQEQQRQQAQQQHQHEYQQQYHHQQHQQRYFSAPAHTLFPHYNGYETQHQHQQRPSSSSQHQQQQQQQHHQASHRPVRTPPSASTDPKETAFLIPHIKPNYRRILHVGCGTGELTRSFSAHVPGGRVVGIDSDPAIIAHAQLLAKQPVVHNHNQNSNHHALHGLRNIQFVVGNVLGDSEGKGHAGLGLPFADREFDIVYCNQYLASCADPVAAFVEMNRVCRPGGFVAARELDFPVRWYPYTEGLQLFDKYAAVVGPLPTPLPTPKEREIESSSPLSLPTDSPPNFDADGDEVENPVVDRGGCMLHVWARRAGFPLTKISKSVSAEVRATEPERLLFAARQVRRMEDEGVRKRWMALGASEEEFAVMSADLEKWVRDGDGWYAEMHAEVVCSV